MCIRDRFSGVGYGGSCFPKDVKAIISTAKDHGYEFRIGNAVEEVNERQKSVQLDQIRQHFGDELGGMRFAIWGLAFKPNTDDMREAPAVVLSEALLAAGAKVVASDPEAIEESRSHYLGDRIEYVNQPLDALNDADALVLVTEWNEFRRPDFDEIKKRLKSPVIFDGRNIWPRETLKDMGFSYYGIGR